MLNDDEKKLSDQVISKINCDNERSQLVLTSLVKHLHAFIGDVELTEAEWMHAVDFLTRT